MSFGCCFSSCLRDIDRPVLTPSLPQPVKFPGCKKKKKKKSEHTLPETVYFFGSVTSLHSVLCALTEIPSPANGQEQYIFSVL